MKFTLESAKQDWPRCWELIGAPGNIDEALQKQIGSRLCRLMCGRSLTSRLGPYGIRGYAPMSDMLQLVVEIHNTQA